MVTYAANYHHMNTNIKGTNIELTDAIRDYVAKRFQAVEKFVKDDTTVQIDIELGKTTEHHKHGDIYKAEAHIVGKGRDIYVTAEKADLYAAIDALRDEVMHRLSSSKDKRISVARAGGAKVKRIIKQIFGGDESAA
jgi:putative sigma-54 modulation protein